jgi:glycosyltransferase involved in cell wall biosynthesis
MTHTPLTSVVIPCYNQAHFLAEAIESALGQTAARIEVIVVNDGSTDGTSDVARRYRPVRLIEQSNRGLSRARNAGLAAAAGEFVVFLDADDRLLPHAVAFALALAARDPAIAMVAGQCRTIAENGAPLAMPDLPAVERDHYRALLSRNFVWTPGAACFRSAAVVAAGGFDPAVSGSADYSLYLRLARAHPLVSHSTAVVEYRRHERNMSRDALLMLRDTLRVLDAERPHVPAHLHDAYVDARRAWRAFYGERLVDELRDAARHDADLGALLRRAWALVRYYPDGAVRHLRRAIVRRARGAPPDAPPRVFRTVTSRGTGDPGR